MLEFNSAVGLPDDGDVWNWRVSVGNASPSLLALGGRPLLLFTGSAGSPMCSVIAAEASAVMRIGFGFSGERFCECVRHHKYGFFREWNGSNKWKRSVCKGEISRCGTLESRIRCEAGGIRKSRCSRLRQGKVSFYFFFIFFWLLPWHRTASIPQSILSHSFLATAGWMDATGGRTHHAYNLPDWAK